MQITAATRNEIPAMCGVLQGANGIVAGNRRPRGSLGKSGCGSPLAHGGWR